MVKALPPSKPDMPEPPPGMALHVAPIGHSLWLEDFEYYDQLGRDPLQQAKLWLLSDPEERVAKLDEVLEQYPKQRHRQAMLCEAALRGDEALVQRLVDAGVKVHPDIPAPASSEEEQRRDEETREAGNIPDREDTSVLPVHSAALRGHLGCLKILLEQGKADVDIRDDTGRTLLMLGAKHPHIVRYLLDRGADPTARAWTDEASKAALTDFAGCDALESAAAWANVESLKMLLEHPIYGSPRSRKSRAGAERGVWVTPLAIQAAADSRTGFEALSLLLERGGYPLEAAGGKTKGELLSDEQRAAIEKAIPGAVADGALASAKLLLSYIYPTDLDGNIIPVDLPESLHKPLVWGAYTAINNNDVDKLEFLRGFGVTEHESMSLDTLPAGQQFNVQHMLEKAAEHGAVDSARLMLEKYGADPNKHRVPIGTKPLYAAAGHDKVDMVRLLVEQYGADIHLGSGRYAAGPVALWVAVMLKAFDSVEQLLRYGGPVDYVDEAIQSISEPMTVVLRADYKYRTVRLETKETARAYLEYCKGDWQSLNPGYVYLELGPEDRELIANLQPRRPAEALREVGDDARDWDKEERAKRPEGQEKEMWKIAPPLPTFSEREEGLSKDDDLIPRWRPFAVPARKDDSE
jgi:ankyrin repeat protein